MRFISNEIEETFSCSIPNHCSVLCRQKSNELSERHFLCTHHFTQYFIRSHIRENTWCWSFPLGLLFFSLSVIKIFVIKVFLLKHLISSSAQRVRLYLCLLPCLCKGGVNAYFYSLLTFLVCTSWNNNSCVMYLCVFMLISSRKLSLCVSMRLLIFSWQKFTIYNS